MRRLLLTVAAASPTPALAVNVSDLARVVLGNGAVLQRGAEECGDRLTLGPTEQLALTVAREAARSALPVDQFMSLATSSEASAASAAARPQFCNRTAKRKNVLLDAVKRAGEKLVTARVLKL